MTAAWELKRHVAGRLRRLEDSNLRKGQTIRKYLEVGQRCIGRQWVSGAVGGRLEEMPKRLGAVTIGYRCRCGGNAERGRGVWGQFARLIQPGGPPGVRRAVCTGCVLCNA